MYVKKVLANLVWSLKLSLNQADNISFSEEPSLSLP